MWCNVGFANVMGKIEDIKINGISIGDNLLNRFSKHSIIQNKKILKASTETQQLFYYTRIGDWTYYFESNERVGMTEKPNYRIIGISGSKFCNSKKRKFDHDEIINVIKNCIKTDKLRIHIDKFIAYPFSTTESDEIYVKNNRGWSYDINYKSSGCYNDNVSINFFSELQLSDNYFKTPKINFILNSKELDQILSNKHC
tara:strand:- start:26 stop:622 length:597 start_codon:yes stop_codon:yes gene_type:complete